MWRPIKLSAVAGMALLQGCAAYTDSTPPPTRYVVGTDLVRVDVAPLALTDAVRLGVLSSTNVKEAELEIRQSGNDVLISRSSFYPELYARVTPSSRSGEMANAGTGLRYTLYDFGERAASLNGAVTGVEVSRFELLDQIEKAARKSAEDYIYLSTETEQVNIAQSYQGSVATLESRVRARVDIGIASSVDINEIDTAMLQAETAVLQAQADQSDALEEMSSNIGMTPDAVFDPVKIGQLLAIESSSGPLSYNAFPRIAALNAQVEQAKYERDAVKAGILPRIGLELGVNLGLDPKDGISGQGVTVGPDISEAISLGGGRKARVQNAEIEVSIAERRRNEEIRLARLETVQAQTALIASMQRLAQRKRVVDLSINTRDLMLGEYDVGTRSLRDLLDAEERIFRARTEANEALRSHLEAQLRFIAATNRLSDYLYEIS